MDVRVTTPNCLVYGELVRYPLDINIKCRMLCYWSRLMTTEKLSSKIYKLLFKLYANENIQNRNQMSVNIIWIKTHVKQILIDQFIQNWRSEIGNSSRGHFYSLFKQEFCIEPYLLRLEQKYRIYIAKFRLCNIRIPIETGRWQKVTRVNRKCTKCSKDVIGDEYHYLFICNNTEIQS